MHHAKDEATVGTTEGAAGFTVKDLRTGTAVITAAYRSFTAEYTVNVVKYVAPTQSDTGTTTNTATRNSGNSAGGSTGGGTVVSGPGSAVGKPGDTIIEIDPSEGIDGGDATNGDAERPMAPVE